MHKTLCVQIFRWFSPEKRYSLPLSSDERSERNAWAREGGGSAKTEVNFLNIPQEIRDGLE